MPSCKNQTHKQLKALHLLAITGRRRLRNEGNNKNNKIITTNEYVCLLPRRLDSHSSLFLKQCPFRCSKKCDVIKWHKARHYQTALVSLPLIINVNIILSTALMVMTPFTFSGEKKMVLNDNVFLAAPYKKQQQKTVLMNDHYIPRTTTPMTAANKRTNS